MNRMLFLICLWLAFLGGLEGRAWGMALSGRDAFIHAYEERGGVVRGQSAVSGCEVTAKDLAALNEAGVSAVISVGGHTKERDAPGQLTTLFDSLAKGESVDDALSKVNTVVAKDNRYNSADNQQGRFEAVYSSGVDGKSSLKDLREHNSTVNEARKTEEKK